MKFLPMASLALIALLSAGSAVAQLNPGQSSGGGLSLPGQAPGGTAAGGASAPASAPAPSAPQQSAPPQQDPMSREFRDCIKNAQDAMEAKKQDNPAAIHGCLTGEIKRHEGKIAVASKKASDSLTGAEQKRLEEANTAWRRFRDANCGFYADAKGAPPANLENADCTLRLTVGRALEVDAIVGAAARREASKTGK
jgi:uncharacterized protein YecT (DUF1311 family)